MADGRRAGWTGEKPNIAPNKPVSPRRILSQLVSRNQWNGLSGQPKCDSQRPGATLCDVGDLTTDQKVGGSNPFERTFERTFKRAKPAGQAAHLLAYPSRVFSQTQQPASSPPAGPSGWGRPKPGWRMGNSLLRHHCPTAVGRYRPTPDPVRADRLRIGLVPRPPSRGRVKILFGCFQAAQHTPEIG